MRRIITGTVAFALTLVAFGLIQPTTSLAAPETAGAPLTTQAPDLGQAHPAVRLGGASGGVLGDRLGGASGGVLVHIGEEIPQLV